MEKLNTDFGGKAISIETGRVAKQANGSVLVQQGETIVFVSACCTHQTRPGIDFFPLTVDYREKMYAAGKFPGGFFKREARPSDHEILTMRLIDRPIRPLFPKGYCNEVQIMASVLSADGENKPDILAMIGASAALAISDIPFQEALGMIRVGMINDEFIVNPTNQQMEESKLDLVMAGTRDAVMMVEGESELVTEEVLLKAIEFGHKSLISVIDLQEQLVAKCGKEKKIPEEVVYDQELVDKVTGLFKIKAAESFKISDKNARQEFMDNARKELIAVFENEEDADNEELLNNVKKIASGIEKDTVRDLILTTQKRIDGRGYTDIRPIDCEVGLLPRTHGSALFTRGQTQALGTVTLGTGADEQSIDTLDRDYSKSFMLHYNFPPFSVGEVKPIRGVGRREIGHGYLAERALDVIKPSKDDFPYTIRIVSDIMESNGSSSMATVCAGTLAMMDAGVPIKTMVGGIAMGLIKVEDKVAVLSDILGVEDHLGDMDFKVTGTEDGITAFQMDIKIKGITFEIMKTALEQANEGRKHILGKMKEAIAEPRADLSAYAPRIEKVMVPVDKIGGLIGPGGKNIKRIIEETGASVDIGDDGTVMVASDDLEALNSAKKMITDCVAEPEVGKIYEGKVAKIMDFGAFVEFMPNKDGLVHVSKLAAERVQNVTDVVSEDDIVKVKLMEIDKMGRYNLSIKDALAEEEKKDN